MIKFEDLSDDLVKVLKENGIEEKDLRNHCSDLYVGCKDWQQAHKIASESGKGPASASSFIPQKGSDMDHYPVCLDIAFAYADADYKKRYSNRDKGLSNRKSPEKE